MINNLHFIRLEAEECQRMILKVDQRNSFYEISDCFDFNCVPKIEYLIGQESREANY